MTKIRVLAVDDEEGMLRSYKRVLKILDYELCATAGGHGEAVKAAQETNPDIILMDISLGKSEADGIDAAREINSILDVPVIFVSAYGNAADTERLVEPWSYGYIKKPFDLSEIKNSIEIAVNRSRRIKYEYELLRKDSILKAVNGAATLFLSKEPFEVSLVKTLELLGEAIGAEQICLYKNNTPDDGSYIAESAFEWFSDAIPSQSQVSSPPIVYDKVKPEMRFSLSSGKTFIQDGKGVAAIPVFSGDEWWGFLSVRKKVVFGDSSDADDEALAAAAKIIGSALYQENMKETLLRREEEYRNLYLMTRKVCDNVPDAIWVKNRNGTYSFVNRTFAEKILFAKDTLEPVGKNIDYFAETERQGRPDDSHWYTVDETVVATDDEVFKTGMPVNVETEFYIHGKKSYFDIFRAPFQDDDGNIVGVVGCARDESIRKSVENNLRELNDRFSTFMNAFPGHTFIKDSNGLITYVNSNSSVEDGLYTDDWVGKMEHEIFSRVDSAMIGKTDEKVLTEGFQNVRTEVFLPDDRKRIYNIIKFPIEYANGEKHIGGMFLDITDKVNAETALLESEKRYRSLVENIRVKIVITQDSRVIYANPCVTDFLGLSAGKLEGREMADFIDSEDIRKALDFHRRRHSGETDLPTNYKIRIINNKGESRLHDLTVTVISWGGKPASLNFLIDIEEENRFREELQSSLHEKTLLLEEVHHRVKNNLALINSLLMMQIRNIDHPDVREGLLMARTRIFSIATVHESLYKSDSVSSIPAKQHFGKLGDELLVNYDPKNRLRLTVNGDDAELELSLATPVSIVINELIINAIKYAYDEGEEGEISIGIKDIGDEIEISVRDEGRGIPDGFSIEDADSLGLSLVRNIVKSQLEGEVFLKPGKGTEWIIKIPLQT